MLKQGIPIICDTHQSVIYVHIIYVHNTMHTHPLWLRTSDMPYMIYIPVYCVLDTIGEVYDPEMP